MKKVKNPTKLILFIIMAILLLSVTAYKTRGWLREDGGAWIVSAIYGQSVERHYERDFAPLSEKLTDFGFVFGPSAYANGKTCQVVGYQVISVSYRCWKAELANNTKALDEAFIARWQKDSPELEREILAAGWTKEWNKHQPIDELFRERQEITTIGVVYSKKHGPIRCTLEIGYNPPAYNSFDGQTPGNFRAYKNCYRYISMFGGY